MTEEAEQRRQLLLDGCLLGILRAAGSRKIKLVDRAVSLMNGTKVKSYSDMTAFLISVILENCRL